MHAKQAKEGWAGDFRRQVRRSKVPLDPKVRHFGRQVRRPKLPPDPKVTNLRGQVRRPKLPSRAESPTFGGRVRQPKHATTGRFGGRKCLRLPNLSSSKVEELSLHMHILPPKPFKHAFSYSTTCIHTYISI